MTTATALIDKVKLTTNGRDKEQINKLDGDIDATSTVLTFTYDLGPITPGSIVEIGTELVHVWEVSSSAKTATVERGYLGTTAATATDTTLVTANPRIYKFDILNELNNEILDLSSPMNRLFKVTSVDIEYTPSIIGYNIPGATDINDILEVRYDDRAQLENWPRVSNYDLVRDLSTTEFASGFALFIYEGLMATTMRVTYSSPYTTISSATTNVELTTGIHSQAIDILHLGAALRILSMREIPRNYTGAQPDPRRAEEVPPGAVSGSIRNLQALYERRKHEEAARLLTKYPYRLKF